MPGRTKIPTYKCTMCPVQYLSQSGVDTHIQKEHNQHTTPGSSTSPATNTNESAPKYVPRRRTSTFDCNKCPSRYLAQSGLDKHVEKQHGDDSYAEKQTTVTQSHDLSTNTYVPRKRTIDYKCQNCSPEAPSKYLTQTGLNKHVEKEHSKPRQNDDSWKPVDILTIFQKISSNNEAIPSNRVFQTPPISLKKNKPEKDPNAPKKPLTAYFHFIADERPKVKASYPNLTIGEIGKEMGERWRSLDFVQKTSYEGKAKKDRERYGAEMNEYRT